MILINNVNATSAQKVFEVEVIFTQKVMSHSMKQKANSHRKGGGGVDGRVGVKKKEKFHLC